MRSLSIAVSLFFASALASHHAPFNHAARAPPSTSALISEIAKECQTLCLPFPNTIHTCTSNNPQSDAEIARCTCTNKTYTELKACTDCVVAAGGVLSGAHLDTIQQVQAGFTNFAAACSQQGFQVEIIVPPPPAATNSLTGTSGNNSDSSSSNGGPLVVANAGDNHGSDDFGNTSGASRAADGYQALVFLGLLASALSVGIL